MQRIDCRFKINPKIYSFVSDLPIKKGDYVIVQTSVGEGYARVEDVCLLQEANESYKKVIRIATEQDKKQYEKILDKEREAIKVSKELASSLKLDMDIVNAEYTLDGSKVVIDFISENRVDFRELVKDLAGALKSRIELRQIGIRDQAKMVGGIGICGRVCCCAAHLKDFEKVSIKMAKVQGLSLNPTKISGSCGRLMCCLEYENPYYSEVSQKMPKLNSKVLTLEGVGTIIYQNLLKQTVSVKIEGSDGSTMIKDYTLEEFNKLQKNKNNKQN